jgi:hypothetical protein
MQKMYKTKVLSLGTWPTEGPGFQLAVDAWRAFTAGLERLAQEDVPANDDRVTQLVAAAQQAARQVRVDPHPHPTPQPPSETIQPTASPPQAYPQPTLSLPYPQPQPLTQLSFPHMQAAAAAASTGSAAQRTAGPSGLSSRKRKRESSERPHQVVEQTVPSSLSSAYPHPIISLPSSHAQPTLSLPSPYPHPGLRRVKTSRTGPSSRRPAAGQGGARCRRRTRGSTCRWGRGRRQVPGSSWPSAPGAPS